jgi:hypothetical protein
MEMFTRVCYRSVANNVYVAGSFPVLLKQQLKEILYSYSASTFANSCSNFPYWCRIKISTQCSGKCEREIFLVSKIKLHPLQRTETQKHGT